MAYGAAFVDNITTSGDLTITGNVTNVILVTPNVGTPSYINLTNATGTAANLTANVTNFISVVNDITTNATFYPIFANGITGAISESVSNTKLTFNPSTGLLTSTDYNSSSDARLKNGIETIKSALATVEALRGVTFTWNESNAPAVGMIAQEVKEILPEIVTEDDKGYLGIKYTNMIGILVEAIKELKVEFDEYKKTHP